MARKRKAGDGTVRQRIEDVEDSLRRPIYVPESMDIMKVVQTFREHGVHEAAVLDEYGSLSGIVISESLRIGSNTFDEAIIRYLEKIKHITIGQHTAEELKILIGTALPDGRQLTADVRGRSTETGLPAMVDIDSQEIRKALSEPIEAILRAIVTILEKTPPELAADIADHGIVLTGGGLLLDGMDRLISQTTGMAAFLCVADSSARHAGGFRDCDR